jgi:hypothetical protein
MESPWISFVSLDEDKFAFCLRTTSLLCLYVYSNLHHPVSFPYPLSLHCHPQTLFPSAITSEPRTIASQDHAKASGTPGLRLLSTHSGTAWLFYITHSERETSLQLSSRTDDFGKGPPGFGFAPLSENRFTWRRVSAQEQFMKI